MVTFTLFNDLLTDERSLVIFLKTQGRSVAFYKKYKGSDRLFVKTPEV